MTEEQREAELKEVVLQIARQWNAIPYVDEFKKDEVEAKLSAAVDALTQREAMLADVNLYDIARQVTDEVFGAGTYADMNTNNPSPGAQAAIARSTDAELLDRANMTQADAQRLLRAMDNAMREARLFAIKNLGITRTATGAPGCWCPCCLVIGDG